MLLNDMSVRLQTYHLVTFYAGIIVGKAFRKTHSHFIQNSA